MWPKASWKVTAPQAPQTQRAATSRQLGWSGASTNSSSLADNSNMQRCTCPAWPSKRHQKNTTALLKAVLPHQCHHSSQAPEKLRGRSDKCAHTRTSTRKSERHLPSTIGTGLFYLVWNEMSEPNNAAVMPTFPSHNQQPEVVRTTPP